MQWNKACITADQREQICKRETVFPSIHIHKSVNFRWPLFPVVSCRPIKSTQICCKSVCVLPPQWVDSPTEPGPTHCRGFTHHSCKSVLFPKYMEAMAVKGIL